MTKVLFRYENESNEVVAVFPATWYEALWGCYAHIGQHSVCHPDWVRESTRPAKPSEYAELLAELVAVGYDDLKILKRMPR